MSVKYYWDLTIPQQTGVIIRMGRENIFFAHFFGPKKFSVQTINFSILQCFRFFYFSGWLKKKIKTNFFLFKFSFPFLNERLERWSQNGPTGITQFSKALKSKVGGFHIYTYICWICQQITILCQNAKNTIPFIYS